jgi:hypothetical protein
MDRKKLLKDKPCKPNDKLGQTGGIGGFGCGQRFMMLCLDESKRAIRQVNGFSSRDVPAGERNEH